MPDNFATFFEDMQQPKPGLKYYSVSVTATQEGKIMRSAYTHWVRYTETEPRLEIREGSLVRPEIFIANFKKCSIPYLVVSTEREMIAYLTCGGEALIERELGKKYFFDVIAPRRAAYDGPLGFKSVEALPPTSFFRAPTPKLRMRVLKRDEYKCKLCGRRPIDYSDVELHVHHIRPWATGGLTEEENLITLCHTCHKGLEPHYEVALFKFVGKNITLDADAEIEGMQRYQALIKKAFDQEQKTSSSDARKGKRKSNLANSEWSVRPLSSPKNRES